MTLEKIFIDFSVRKLTLLSSRVTECLDRLSDEQIWSRGGDNQNAIGNLVLHLCGNVRQWIVAGVGGAADVRERPLEFAAQGGRGVSQLREELKRTVAEATSVLDELAEGRLAQRVTIQGYELSVLEAVYTVIEHFAQHTGQVIFATKLLTGSDLGFYRHLSTPGHGKKTP
jgi:uncharacterized damage-inducible protein DinB